MTTLQPISITSLSPEDLQYVGYDLSKITQQDLNNLRSKMADAYIERGYWDDMEIIADSMGFPTL